MAEHAFTDELREAECRLQAAQLAGDIAALDQLLDDRLIFTYGPDGKFTRSRTISSSTSHGSRC